jgi:hypothetical protein
MLRYDQYLAAGSPIGTGVIEGACRYLVKDRMERTGARWSLDGAEAVLRLRALWTHGDFAPYWVFHLRREYERHHALTSGLSLPTEPHTAFQPGSAPGDHPVNVVEKEPHPSHLYQETT